MYLFVHRTGQRHFVEMIQMEMENLMEKNWEILTVFGQWELFRSLLMESAILVRKLLL